MPMYNYECKEHGNFERIRKISEREIAECLVCYKWCPLIVSAPAMVQGGYMDTKPSVTKSNSRKI